MRENSKIRRARRSSETPVNWTTLETRARAACKRLGLIVKFCRQGLRRKWEFTHHVGKPPYLTYFPAWNSWISSVKGQGPTRGRVDNPSQVIVLASSLLQERLGRRRGPIRVVNL